MPRRPPSSSATTSRAARKPRADERAPTPKGAGPPPRNRPDAVAPTAGRDGRGRGRRPEAPRDPVAPGPRPFRPRGDPRPVDHPVDPLRPGGRRASPRPPPRLDRAEDLLPGKDPEGRRVPVHPGALAGGAPSPDRRGRRRPLEGDDPRGACGRGDLRRPGVQGFRHHGGLPAPVRLAPGVRPGSRGGSHAGGVPLPRHLRLDASALGAGGRRAADEAIPAPAPGRIRRRRAEGGPEHPRGGDSRIDNREGDVAPQRAAARLHRLPQPPPDRDAAPVRSDDHLRPAAPGSLARALDPGRPRCGRPLQHLRARGAPSRPDLLALPRLAPGRGRARDEPGPLLRGQGRRLPLLLGDLRGAAAKSRALPAVRAGRQERARSGDREVDSPEPTTNKVLDPGGVEKEEMDNRSVPRMFGPYVLTRSYGSDPIGGTFLAGTARGRKLAPYVLIRTFDGDAVDTSALVPAMETAVEYLDDIRGQAVARGAVLGIVDDVPFAGIDYVAGQTLDRLFGRQSAERTLLPPEYGLLVAQKILVSLEATQVLMAPTGAPHG